MTAELSLSSNKISMFPHEIPKNCMQFNQNTVCQLDHLEQKWICSVLLTNTKKEFPSPHLQVSPSNLDAYISKQCVE